MTLMPRPRLWGDDDKQAVIAMLQKGLSSSAIAQRMHVTRNAAIGRISRDPDLKQHVRVRPPKKAAKDPARAAAPRAAPKAPPEPPRPPAAAPVAVAAKPAPPVPTDPRPLFELGPCQCRFPVAEGEDVVGRHLFCAEATSRGEPYCHGHMVIAMPSRAGLRPGATEGVNHEDRRE